MDIQSPAQATYWLISGRILFLIIHLLGVACFPTLWRSGWSRSFEGSAIFVSTGPWPAWERLRNSGWGSGSIPRYQPPGPFTFLFLRVSFSWRLAPFSADSRHSPTSRCRACPGSRPPLRPGHGLRRHRGLPLHGGRCDSAVWSSNPHAMPCRQSSAKPTRPTPSSCWG